MFERLRQAGRTVRGRVDAQRLAERCRRLLTERGEANSASIAAEAIEFWHALPQESVPGFFEMLARDFDPDATEVLRCATRYAQSRSPKDLIALQQQAESPRQELLRRLNRTQGGTAAIVGMRARLLELLRGDASLTAVDADFQHLLSSWFNPGFLRLVQVDWEAPASLLERIIHHEAVHQIDGWNDLRRRLEPDRRCFAFFHPALPDEPLIFVEVALLGEMPSAIEPLIDREAPIDADARKAKVAVFYSISNCQPGLRGVNLGNFLIKQVADHLRRELPSLKTFCTLSPVPSLASWLSGQAPLQVDGLKPARRQALQKALDGLRERHGADLAGLRSGEQDESDRQALSALTAHHLSLSGKLDPRRADPVARFHLSNGARLERINPGADRSRKGIKQSYGVMVNYLYDLGSIERHHQMFIDGQVSMSRGVAGLI